jgi:hypothetical protein
MDLNVVNSFMDKDRVRPAQLQSYLHVLTGKGVQARLAAVAPVNAHGQAGGVPAPVAAQLTSAMRAAGLPKSHVWVKGLVAVYCATQAS